MSEFNELYPMVFRNCCGHTTTITCSPSDAGAISAEQSTENCMVCDQNIWEKEHEAAIDAYERAMEENYLADGLPLIRPSRCSHFNAICPQASVCYSEDIEFTVSECSRGMVLCHDVDNSDNKYMYSVDLFKAEDAIDPCFHCKNLGLDTADNCGDCDERAGYAATEGCDEDDDQDTMEVYDDEIPF